jgi:hypothetical protein
MTTPTGMALRMRCELAELARRHNVTPVPHTVPLLPSTECSMVLKGFASTGDVDFDRCRFASFSFGLLRKSKTRLLYAHDEAQVAGEILDLGYDPHGNLLVEAKVSHPQAVRCGGFSVGGRIRGYRLVDTDRPTFHAVIDDCELCEISLTERPANRFALVRSRFPADAQSQFYDDLLKWVDTLKKMVTLLPQVAAATASATPSAGATMHKNGRRWPQRGDHLHGGVFYNGCITDAPLPRRQVSKSSFTELAEALNGRLQET